MKRCGIAWLPATFIALAFLTGGSGLAIAGLRGKSPYSWSVASENGKFLFVAIAEHSIDEQYRMLDREANNWEDEELTAKKHQIQQIQQRYRVSGMYPNDGSNVPLWIYDSWWIDRGFPSLDGQQFIVIGEGAYGNLSHFDIVHIYDKTGLVRTLYESDLVPPTEIIARQFLPDFDGYPPSHSFELTKSGQRLIISSELGDTVHVSLIDGRIVRRDLTPGSIAERASVFMRWIIAGSFLTFVGLVTLITIRVRSRCRNRKPSTLA